MSIDRNRYIVLALSEEDARSHPAFNGAHSVVVPDDVKYGLIITGFVTTDAFIDACTQSDALGDAARRQLMTAKRNVSASTAMLGVN